MPMACKTMSFRYANSEVLAPDKLAHSRNNSPAQKQYRFQNRRAARRVLWRSWRRPAYSRPGTWWWSSRGTRRSRSYRSRPSSRWEGPTPPASPSRCQEQPASPSPGLCRSTWTEIFEFQMWLLRKSFGLARFGILGNVTNIYIIWMYSPRKFSLFLKIAPSSRWNWSHRILISMNIEM